MTKYFSIVATLFLGLSFFVVYGQTPVETAHQKGVQAVKLEDEGKFDEALALLAEAEKLDPKSIVYPYETTYCFYNQKQYQKVIDILEKLKERPDSFDRLYQLLGNSYDDLDQSDKAIAIYEEGLKKFPKSGCLYLERGVVPLIKKNYNEAIKYFEKGIEAQPNFPSNYFRAAKLYCISDNPMWGMIYGEIFMNLERNTARTQEMSKLLFDTYKSNIKFVSPNKVTTSFGKAVIDASSSDGAKLKIPYSMIYEPTMLVAIGAEKEIDLNSLDRIRQNFLKFYMQRGFDKTYPNALFAYQSQIEQSGNLEAYNHWLLLRGDETAFNTWMAANKTKWDDFVKWFVANPIKLNDTNKFYRMQY